MPGRDKGRILGARRGETGAVQGRNGRTDGQRFDDLTRVMANRANRANRASRRRALRLAGGAAAAALLAAVGVTRRAGAQGLPPRCD